MWASIRNKALERVGLVPLVPELALALSAKEVFVV